MLATPRRDTPCEIALRSALHRLGLRFRVDWPLPGTRRRADLAFPRFKVALFVDGCFWHCCPIHRTWPKANAAWWRRKILGNVRRDRDTDARLSAAGWKVLRFWEHEDMDEAAPRAASTIRRRARKRVIG
jgi:DNA mismatch endonuclease (patch repair protein)